MLKFFKRRSPAHRAESHVTPSPEDMVAAYSWNLTLHQWQSLSDFERSECRRNITAAPRFVA